MNLGCFGSSIISIVLFKVTNINFENEQWRIANVLANKEINT